MKDMFRLIGRGLRAISKKVWVTLAFLAVIFSVGAVWIGVSNAMAAFKPPSWSGLELTAEQRATVSGNGGPAVMVGNWLYFVGNYVETSSIQYRQNEHNRVTYGAIYRVYIDPTEGLMYEDGKKFDEYQSGRFTPHLLDNSRFHLVVPKVAGFDQAALWVFDDVLIYTSPNNERDRRGDLQLGRIDFFRVDLDGRNHRRLYTTANDMITTDRFTVASYNGNVFILVHDGEMLRRISVTDRPGRVVTVSRDVAGFVALPIVTSYREDFEDEEDDMPVRLDTYSLANSYGGIMRFVYFTEARDEDEQKIYGSGNRVVQYDVFNDNKIETRINDHNISLLGLSNGQLVYTVRNMNGTSLGLFATQRYMTDTITDPFDIARKPARPKQDKPDELETPKFLNDFRILAAERWNIQGDEVHLRTVHTPHETYFKYAVMRETTMHLYRSSSESPFATLTGVSRIIMINENIIHFLDGEGNFAAASLNDGARITVGRLSQPLEENVRPWVLTRYSAVWHFHIRSYNAVCEDEEHNHEHETMTIAMLADIWQGTGSFNIDRREFILGRLDCKFLNNPDDSCDIC